MNVILRALSCGYVVNTDVFEQYFLQTAKQIVSLYDFYYMPQAVHAVLVHGASYMRTFPVPIGILSGKSTTMAIITSNSY